MLTTKESKLLAKWQGPFEVIKKLDSTTYEIATPGQSHPSRTLHINLLKEWVPSQWKTLWESPVCCSSGVGDEEVEEHNLPVPAPSMPYIDHLSESQVSALCTPDVFKETHGCTTVVEHDIILKNGASVRRMSYQIPECLLGPLKKEIDLMLSLDIIEAFKSEWCNPIVLVPKKDRTIRCD